MGIDADRFSRRRRRGYLVDDHKRNTVGGVCNYARYKQGCSSGDVNSAWQFLNKFCGLNSGGWVQVGHRQTIVRAQRGVENWCEV